MNTNHVAIILLEDEDLLSELALSMHIWVAGTDKNIMDIKTLWKSNLPKSLSQTYFEITPNSTKEQQCILALDQVESHHSSTFGAESWLKIQVYGVSITSKLSKEFLDYENTTIVETNYGFIVSRPNET